MFRTVSYFAAAALSVALALPLSPATAAIGNNWPLLSVGRAGGCELSIASAGHAMQLRAQGLIPGEAIRLVITNGDMKPISATAYANNRGALLQYYLPFRFGRSGGIVQVNIAAARCNLMSAAAWTREVPVIR